MPINSYSGPLEDVARVIELAIAPVFLLTAIGTILGVLSNRLARIVDRARVLTDRVRRASSDEIETIQQELRLLFRRRRLVNLAITCGTFTALLVCTVIGAAFLAAILQLEASQIVAVLFVLAMFTFIAALVLFLSEIILSASSTRMDLS